MAEYPINKGIGRPVEFKGLKAQYLFIFCGGLLALFVLFVILYMVGIDQWICIGFGGNTVSHSYTYDANGNILSDGSTTYAYDSLNQLVWEYNTAAGKA